jgi:hypothetical protein
MSTSRRREVSAPLDPIPLVIEVFGLIALAYRLRNPTPKISNLHLGITAIALGAVEFVAFGFGIFFYAGRMNYSSDFAHNILNPICIPLAVVTIGFGIWAIRPKEQTINRDSSTQ